MRKVCGKFCGKFAEICPKTRLIAPGKGADILHKNSPKFFWNYPFPNSPISELLRMTTPTLAENILRSELSAVPSHRGVGRCFEEFCEHQQILDCEPSGPLQHSKMPRTPNLSKTCPDDWFSGSQIRGTQICQTLVKKTRQFPDKFFNFSANF